MNKLNKNYLVIKNVCSDKNLRQYLEQICQEENVSILYEEFNQFDIWNNKQSVYAEFDAKPSFDLLLWCYDENKLNYINYLYSDFEARYRSVGKVVSRIVESMDNGDNLDEGEKLDKAIRDDLSKGWTVHWHTPSNTQFNSHTQINPEIKENAECFTEYLNYDLNKSQKDNLRKNLGAWATGDWKIGQPEKQPTLKQKVYKFYNKHELIFDSVFRAVEQTLICLGLITVLTIIFNMVK